MASGRTHAKWTTAGIVGISGLAAYLYFTGFVGALGLIPGAIIGHLCTPDLDQHQVRTHDEATIYRINPVAGRIWETYWLMYGFLVKHRSWVSHAPIIGTLIRFFYLFGPPIAIIALTGNTVIVEIWMLYALSSWGFQDLIHLALDGFKYYD